MHRNEMLWLRRWHLMSSMKYCSNRRSRSIINIDNDNVIRSPFTDVVIPADMNLSEYVWRNVERWKQKPALTCALTGRSYTYNQSLAATNRLTQSLPHYTGLQPGDVLAILLPNSPEYTLLVLAAVAAGIVVSPANITYTTDELARQFTDAGAKCVVTTPALLEKVQHAINVIPGGAQLILATDGSDHQESALNDIKLISLQGLLRQEVSHKRRQCISRPEPDSMAALLYSSGTTGLPKGVCLTHYNLIANLCQMDHPDILRRKTPPGFQDTSLSFLPYFHIYGFNGVLAINMSFGRHTVILPHFEAFPFIKAFNQYKPTVIHLVPPLLSLLSTTERITAETRSYLQFAVCGAAPANAALIETFKQHFKETEYREGFGMTETSCMALFSPPGMPVEKIGSCGQPVPLTAIKISDETGQALPLGQQGELMIKGPQVMQGYHKNEAATLDCLSEDGWLKTGDVAYVDQEGYVFLVDRIKELIKVKGLQVSPTELEDIIRRMQGVTDVAVVGIPDEHSGEVPRAFIVASSDISDSEVKAFLEPRVAPHKRLAGGVRFVKEIPKNAAGKTLRKVLVKLP